MSYPLFGCEDRIDAGPVGISTGRCALGPVGIEERADPLAPFVGLPGPLLED